VSRDGTGLALYDGMRMSWYTSNRYGARRSVSLGSTLYASERSTEQAASELGAANSPRPEAA
jgi:hypothetical protein